MALHRPTRQVTASCRGTFFWLGVSSSSRKVGAVTRAPREELPRFVEPMLATSGLAPEEDGWALEVKFDGMRAQVRHDGSSVRVRSRPGRACSDEFPELDGIRDALAPPWGDGPQLDPAGQRCYGH